MTDSSRAVFLSYASQDGPAAQKICEALRAAGIEVWFDQSELRGGDAWDRKIREQIHHCRLFIPIISVNSEHRDEGYFRREWSLAAERTRDMAHKRAFLVPVVIDGTPERGASVPEKFHELQWTRLPNGETPPAFVERVKRLLSTETSTTVPETTDAESVAGGVTAVSVKPPRSPKRGLLVALSLAVLGAGAYFAIEKLWIPKQPAMSSATVASSAMAATFTPPPHSIAVLPFVNMSGDKEQEYFSDGLTEELLNSLAEANELQVAARTSAFSFKGRDTDIRTIARDLNVGAVLEGSVRRSGNTVRITAQLINAVTGFDLWSHTYDRDLTDVLKMQTEIANAVASALKVRLLSDVEAKIELGGTRNPAALDAYLRASKAYLEYAREAELQTAIAGYSEAIRQDPGYSLAFAYRSMALDAYARNFAAGRPTIRQSYYTNAQRDANEAIALTPELAEAHLALAVVLRNALEFIHATQEYQRAVTLGPGNAQVLEEYGIFSVEMGKTEPGLAAVRRAVALDPLNPDAYSSLGYALGAARRDAESIKAYMDAQMLAPSDGFVNAGLSYSYYFIGDLQSARTACERADESNKPICFALVYQKLGRQADAQKALSQVVKRGTALPVAYIYTQWGDIPRALEWLETAMRQRDPYLIGVRTWPEFDPLRKEPRFQAIERALKFPD